MKKIQILCTLGPSSLNKRVITRLTEDGVAMFRINLSHTKLKDIEGVVRKIRQYTSVPICIDTEGPQVRSGALKNGKVRLKENGKLILVNQEVLGTNKSLNLAPLSVLGKIKIGDLISIDFDSVLLTVTSLKEGYVESKVISGGWLGSNKAVTIDRNIDLPALSSKDKEGIKIIKKYGLRNISLSFVRSKGDVEYVKNFIGPDVYIISKIETNDALGNLNEILAVSDAVLIDRGDLSREEPINKIPLLQKSVIKIANKSKKPVWVATNLLESMVKSKKPLRSEVNDVMNTLIDGADGLVLAAETAIGDYPVECVSMINRIIKYYQISEKGYDLPELLKNDSFLLIEPHGGSLVKRYNEYPDHEAIAAIPPLVVDERVIMDAEQIGIGTYSPLEGFMTKDELYGVLDHYRLPNKVVWTLPIVLQVSKEESKRFTKNDKVALVYKEDGLVYAVLHVQDIFNIDLEKVAKRWFGTVDLEHPGVQHLFKKGECFIGGKIDLIRRRSSEYKEFEFTPQQMRIIFENREWSKIAGFHTRNAIHRAHEYLQLSALEKYGLDGLLLHPVIGPKKLHDFKPQIILESYQVMLDHFYPKGKVVLGAFSAYSHYAGPREAVFTALCRKNFGCSHFIVGRDHTGVKDYYESDASHRLFDKLEADIGIIPIFYNTVHYCKKCRTYVEECRHGKDNYLYISGTQARKMLQEKKQPPAWFLRKKITELILEKIEKGLDVFVK